LKEMYKLKKEEVRSLKRAGQYRKKDVIPFDSFLPEKRIIAEVKQASPSLGKIKNVDVVEQAKTYEKAGAAAISVLTDKYKFAGSFEFLKRVSEAVSLPVLCKDFIVDNVQIDIAYQFGADAVLLIASMLEKSELEDLFYYASKLGLYVLLEIHEEDELEKIEDLPVKFLGVNNRDLKTLKINRNKGIKIIRKLQGKFVLVAESGMESAENIRDFYMSGAEMFLVGTALMKAENAETKLKELSRGFLCL